MMEYWNVGTVGNRFLCIVAFFLIFHSSLVRAIFPSPHFSKIPLFQSSTLH